MSTFFGAIYTSACCRGHHFPRKTNGGKGVGGFTLDVHFSYEMALRIEFGIYIPT